MLVVGGGVIGCEYACMFAILGVEVTVVEQRDRLIGSLDAEISATLQHQMEQIGIRVILDDSVDSLDVGDEIEVRLKSGTVLKPHTILVSSGRAGNTKGLGLEDVGVGVDDRGLVKVNAHFQTEVPNIYAAGDVIGSPALASTAMEQARVAMVHAFDLKYKDVVSVILPYGIYTIPECSMAGETEESLKAKGVPYVVGKATYATNARGHIIGDDKGFLKLLFRARRHEAAGRPHDRRAGDRADPRRPDGADHGAGGRPVHPDLLQLPDAHRALQVRHLRRAGPPRRDDQAGRRRRRDRMVHQWLIRRVRRPPMKLSKTYLPRSSAEQ